MRFSNLACYLSILSVINGAVLVVTETKVNTVFVDGNGVTQTAVVAAPSSSAVSSSAESSSSVVSSSSIESSSSVTSTSSTVTAEAKFIQTTETEEEDDKAKETTPPAKFVPTTETTEEKAQKTSTPETTEKAPSTLVTKKSTSSTPTSTSSTATATPTSSGSDSGSDDFASSILKAHNEKRALHGVSNLKWDDQLAQYAKDYASKYDCSGSLTHSGGKYGENLAVGYSNGVKALDAWYDEGKSYDYSSASSFDHFTQVVWKSTTKLGCAQKDCSAKGWGKYVICSYDPAGNMIGSGKANVLQG